MSETKVNEQGQRLRDAIAPVLEIGPDFIAGRLHADKMANTMVAAVQSFVTAEQAAQHPDGESRNQLALDRDVEQTVMELYACGSGYLAQRCDSACVVRTMTQIVGEYAKHAD